MAALRSHERRGWGLRLEYDLDDEGPGGFVAVIARPVRERGAVWLATSHLAESLADTGAKLEAYVVAVDAAASEDWHLLLARVPDGA